MVKCEVSADEPEVFGKMEYMGLGWFADKPINAFSFELSEEDTFEIIGEDAYTSFPVVAATVNATSLELVTEIFYHNFQPILPDPSYEVLPFTLKSKCNEIDTNEVNILEVGAHSMVKAKVSKLLKHI
mmetsp:Transcript_3207/g.4842  ORF Transcript_3207/g.4842 Transcript_3207/m.4842 type:complete len:128 (+) Transcript_3207:357-740(+)